MSWASVASICRGGATLTLVIAGQNLPVAPHTYILKSSSAAPHTRTSSAACAASGPPLATDSAAPAISADRTALRVVIGLALCCPSTASSSLAVMNVVALVVLLDPRACWRRGRRAPSTHTRAGQSAPCHVGVANPARPAPSLITIALEQ